MLRFAPVAFSPTLPVNLFQEEIKAISAEAFLFASVAGVVQSESEISPLRGARRKAPAFAKNAKGWATRHWAFVTSSTPRWCEPLERGDGKAVPPCCQCLRRVVAVSCVEASLFAGIVVHVDAIKPKRIDV
jgi:hypothetical protein